MKLFVLSAGIFVLLGCASTPPATNPNVVYLKEGDRVPASDPTTQWDPATISIDIRNAQESKSAVVTVNQEMIWDTTQQVYTDAMEYREVQIPSTCTDYTCDDSSAGNGKSELWNQYFSAPASQKAQALNTAIYGVGPTSAQALVQNNFFRSKPRSWSEFTAEIQRAADAGVIKQSVATNVIYNSSAENRANLGYGQNSCQQVAHSCSMWVSQLTPVKKLVNQTVTQKKVINTKQFNVDIHVSGAKLMSSESDHLDFTLNENGQLADTSGDGGLNRYTLQTQVDGNHITILANQTQRILKDLSSNVVTQDQFILVNNTPTFILNVDSSYLPTSEDPQSQLVVDYTVQDCEYGWTGTCGFSPWKTLKLASAQIRSNRLVIPVTIPAHNKGRIVYTVTRRNSAFYNNNPTEARNTDSVKMSR